MTNPDSAFSFDHVFEAHYVEIFHYIRKLTTDIELAKDLTQDVFMNVYEKRHTYNPAKAGVRTWIYRIAYHLVLNHFHSAAVRTRVDDSPWIDGLVSGEADPLERLLREDDVSSLLALMKRILPKKQERLLHLIFFSGLDTEAIALVLGVSVKTVHNLTSVAIKTIRTHMEVQNGLSQTN